MFQVKKLNSKIIKFNTIKIIRFKHLCDQIYMCTCNHPDYSHQYGEFVCDYENCSCLGFSHKEIEMVFFIDKNEKLINGDLVDYKGGIF
jgi:hypothetical protein